MQIENKNLFVNSKNKIVCIILLQFIIITNYAQTSIVNTVSLLKQQSMSSMGILHGNYSGITKINKDTFAIISDKPLKDGHSVKILKIEQSPDNGKITNIKEISTHYLETKNNLLTNTDYEDIIFNSHKQTFYICDEANQEILEYDKALLPTGKSLNIPDIFCTTNIFNNKGFEALAYSHKDSTIWTTTENSLKADAPVQSDKTLIRLQCFNKHLKPIKQYIYEIDSPIFNKKYKTYTFGVPAITILDDGRLLIMERELCIKKNYINSFTKIKIFIVYPISDFSKMASAGTLKEHKLDPILKNEVCSFSTHLKLGKINFGNYEGMCLGRKLNDGRQTIILISDSQDGAGNIIYRLKDYLKVIVINEIEQ